MADGEGDTSWLTPGEGGRRGGRGPRQDGWAYLGASAVADEESEAGMSAPMSMQLDAVSTAAEAILPMGAADAAD